MKYNEYYFLVLPFKILHDKLCKTIDKININFESSEKSLKRKYSIIFYINLEFSIHLSYLI